MLTVRAEQREALWLAAIRPDEDVLLAHVQRHFARLCTFLGEAQVRLALRRQIRRAQEHGLDTLPAICLYVSVAFMVGTDFDQDRLLAWAPPLLRAPGDPEDRALALFDQTVRYLDEVDGDDREHGRCLLRVRRFDIATLGPLLDGDPAGLDQRISSLLHELQPRKHAVVGDKAVRAFVRRGADSAHAAGLAGAAARGLHTALMFFLGQGYHRDPLYPWAARTLASGAAATEDARLTLLHGETMAFLDAVLPAPEPARPAGGADV